MADVLSQTCQYKVRSARVERLGQATAVAMQQIADWLKKLGMSEYTDRFVENRIDLSVLPDLTDPDLKDLGILLGDRRKLLRAIRELGATTTWVQRVTAAESENSEQSQRGSDRTQRCYISRIIPARIDASRL
jgi:hypothetical protein